MEPKYRIRSLLVSYSEAPIEPYITIRLTRPSIFLNVTFLKQAVNSNVHQTVDYLSLYQDGVQVVRPFGYKDILTMAQSVDLSDMELTGNIQFSVSQMLGYSEEEPFANSLFVHFLEKI